MGAADGLTQSAGETRRYGPVEVFRAGTFQPMGGGSFEATAENLHSIASTYDAESAPAPIVIGHPSTDAPAYGWVDSLYVEGSVLKAMLRDVHPAFVDLVKKGQYKKISVSLFLPKSPGNPKPGEFYLRHVGFLGAAAPAVPNLKPVGFAQADDMFNLVQDVAFSAADRELQELRQILREQKVEKLISEGRILPCMKDELLEFAESLDDRSNISFASGSEGTQKQHIFQILEKLPPCVQFGEHDMSKAIAIDDMLDQHSGIDVPEGYKIDPKGQELFERAKHIQRERSISFSDAVDIATGRR